MSQQQNSENSEIDGSDIKNQNPGSLSVNDPIKTELKAEEKDSFIDKWKTSRFWLIRGSFYVLRSIWMTVMVIGGFILWLISFLFI
ncbi:hypothetical protein [Aequorivita viscosa]|uniref:Uncharacterized protein n=1 Tax=Aequorivita viscosa TaxID=797419 RepID=A0A1M6F588_9FLAO|nr:hypothetical protein [Aequorivita viscosa]SDW65053.1 hypothetical protein SAMN05216556_10849 [Aequorivita viscosa]SHI92841.1 hypothetical protein SAMN04487908_10748 [Aequorivita viscosa]